MKYNKSHFEDPKFLYFRSSLVSFRSKNTGKNNGFCSADRVKNVTLMSNTIGSLLLKLFQILIANKIPSIDHKFVHDIHNFIINNFPSTLHIKELLIFYSYLYLGLDYLNRDITKRSIIREFWNFLIMEAPIPLSQYDKFSIKDLNEKDENELVNEPLKISQFYILGHHIIPFTLFNNYDPYNLYDWKDGEYQLLYKNLPQINIEEEYEKETYIPIEIQLEKDNPILLSLQFDALLCNNKFPQPFVDVINNEYIYKFATLPHKFTSIFIKLIVEVYNFIDNENGDKTKCKLITQVLEKDKNWEIYKNNINNLLSSSKFRLDLDFNEYYETLDLKNPEEETLFDKRQEAQDIKYHLRYIIETFEEYL